MNTASVGFLTVWLVSVPFHFDDVEVVDGPTVRLTAAQAFEELPQVGSVPSSQFPGDRADCWPKYILCGSNVTIHLLGHKGTIAYRLGHARYLAKLERYIHPIDPPKRDMYFFAHCSDPTTSRWAIGVTPDCEGRYPVWRYTRGGWCLMDLCYRERLH